MASLKHLKDKIKTLQSMQKITKTMKLVSTAKLKKAKTALEHLREYNKDLEESVEKIATKIQNIAEKSEKQFVNILSKSNLAKAILKNSNPDLDLNPDQDTSPKNLFIILSPDRGLCGSLNNSIAKKLKSSNTLNNEPNNLLYFIGKKGLSSYRIIRKDCGTVLNDPEIEEKINTIKTYEDILEVSSKIQQYLSQHEVTSIKLIYPKFISSMVNQVVEEDICIKTKDNDEQAKEVFHIFEQDPEETIDIALKQYLSSVISLAIFNSLSSEHGARMVAMDQTSNNAQKSIENLIIPYNKIRQSNITQEIAEIISGAESS